VIIDFLSFEPTFISLDFQILRNTTGNIRLEIAATIFNTKATFKLNGTP
jgi:hypothetical protein